VEYYYWNWIPVECWFGTGYRWNGGEELIFGEEYLVRKA
jgi:hypothetical protein